MDNKWTGKLQFRCTIKKLKQMSVDTNKEWSNKLKINQFVVSRG